MSSISATNQLNQMTNDTNKLKFEQGQKNLGSSKTLDKDGFLQLLLTQLKYQDPINPVDNAQFISQQAQFTQIEKLDDLNNTLNSTSLLSQASSLVGQKISYRDDKGATQIGRVDSVKIDAKNIGLSVGGALVKTSQVQQIFADTQP
jgi:flagellar basal-body rod modification protein FlgD